MINVFNVTHHYGLKPVLKDINLRVNQGELVTIMGPNGMGKSTLLGVIADILQPVRGHVEIAGMKRRESEEQELDIRRKMVYLPDQPWMPLMRTGREFLLAVGRLYEIEDLHLMDHIERVLQLFSLEDKADSPIMSYSTGQRKKIGLASALVSEAPILLLDEPFSGGLDPSGLLAMKSVLKRMAEREDMTVLMATPVPELVEGLAHRVAIIKEGELLAYDTPDGLRQQTSCDGPLQEVLEKLINPQTLNRISNYFEERDL